MSIFGNIKDAIFGHKTQAAAPKPAASPAGSIGAAGAGMAAPVAPPPPPAATTMATGGVLGAVTGGLAAQPVDVEKVLSDKAAASGKPSNWRTSIVDLMTLLGLDSSLHNREELADELGYTGTKGGSAEMNMWLHKAVMKKLAENGGQVPASLRD